MNLSNFYQTSSEFNNLSSNHISSNPSTSSILPESNQPLNPFQSLSIKSFKQALLTSYPSRLRLGTTSLVQPIFTNSYIQQRSNRAHSPLDDHHLTTNHTTISNSNHFHSNPVSVFDLGGRRTRKVVNYSENDSKLNEFESDSIIDETNLRNSKLTTRNKLLSNQTFLRNSSSNQNLISTLNEIDEKKKEIDELKKRKYGDGQIYLDQEPPAKLIKVQRRLRKPIGIMNLLSLVNDNHDEKNVDLKEVKDDEEEEEEEDRLIPIRIEFDTDEIRIRDVFTWNLSEKRITPESFAIEFCYDIDISPIEYVPKIIEQINSQLKEHSLISNLKLLPNLNQLKKMKFEELEGIEPDLRVIINLDVQIQTLHLVDRIEWDLGSTLSPELFTKQYISELNLPTSSLPIISHSIHEEILKHKKECLSIGLISSNHSNHHSKNQLNQKIIFESDPLLREKFGNQKGCKKLDGIFRDWNECNLFGPKIEFLHGEDLEWIEIEKERLIRRARRENARVGRRR